MKKVLLTLIALPFIFSNLSAQTCGIDGPNACGATGGPQGGGFQDLNNVPCIERGVAYNQSIQFSMFEIFNYLGQQTVDSIKFESISNLPCGICWGTDRADRTYKPNQDGCINLRGTTNDNVGQYKFNMTLKAWVNGQPGLNVPSTLAEQAGIKLFIRVKDNGSSTCPNVDTSASGNNLTASCAIGIQDQHANVTNLSIVPNPVIATAAVTFTAGAHSAGSIRTTDITGKEVMHQRIDINAGINTVTLDRSNLPAGVYFLMIHDGRNTITRRFSIAD